VNVNKVIDFKIVKAFTGWYDMKMTKLTGAVSTIDFILGRHNKRSEHIPVTLMRRQWYFLCAQQSHDSTFTHSPLVS